MITQIEIDGFKTFKDFKLELAPLQVIVGPNGAGKSNLFDALQLLSQITERDLLSFFQNVRGEDSEIFTKFRDGRNSQYIRIAIEMLLDLPKERSSFWKEFELKYRRLRYELQIIDDENAERFYITHEALYSIPMQVDSWAKKYQLYTDNGWLQLPPQEKRVFIDTLNQVPEDINTPSIFSMPSEENLPFICFYPDDEKESPRCIPAKELNTTILSRGISIGLAGSSHIAAVKQELQAYKFLHLNPDTMRQPCSSKGPSTLTQTGSNLARLLAMMKAKDEDILKDISRSMMRLVPNLLKIDVEKDALINKYVIQAQMTDQRIFTAEVLSDGTLRLLALATLKNDPRFHGILCLEEPENGVDPLHMRSIAQFLRSMVTDFQDASQKDQPLKQVLVITHSPTFISLPEIRDSLIFAVKVTRTEPGQKPIDITRMVTLPSLESAPKPLPSRDTAMEAYTINQVQKYLISNHLDAMYKELDQIRETLPME